MRRPLILAGEKAIDLGNTIPSPENRCPVGCTIIMSSLTGLTGGRMVTVMCSMTVKESLLGTPTTVATTEAIAATGGPYCVRKLRHNPSVGHS